MDINRYELILDQNNYTIVIYLDPQLSEFSNELGRSPNKKKHLQVQIRNLIKEKFPNVPITAAKVMAGSLLVTTIYLGATATTAGAATSNTHIPQTNQYDVYTVKSGDSLSIIAKRFNVSVASIKTVNGLTSDTIYIGQKLNLPFLSYSVASGDTLFIIAKRFNTSAESIRSFNQLTSEKIFVGQIIKIPRTAAQETTVTPTPIPPPTVENKDTTSTHTVVAGDSLSLIAKKLGTTVDTIRSLNHLTTDMIFVGQLLKVPKNQSTDTNTPAPPVTEPAPLPEDTTVTKPAPATYTVVSGDSLSLIAKKFATTVDTIKIQNNLTSDMIFVGQTLTIPPNKGEQVQPPEPPKEITTSYTVVAGDSLFHIAKRLNTTVDAIKSANNLSTDMIYVGQILKIPTKETVTQLPADTVAPTVPVLNPIGPITTRNQSSLSVSGSTEANAIVNITLTDGNNSPIKIQIKSDANGRFENKVDVSKLRNGTIVISAKAVDSSGNESKVTTLSVIKDTVATEPVIDTGKQVTIENANKYTISGVTEPGAKVEITVSDGVNPEVITEATANELGEFRSNVDLRSLDDGQLAIAARAIDMSGNSSVVHQTTVTKKTSIAPPVIESADIINSQTEKNYTIFGIARPGTTVDITVSDGTNPDVIATSVANENGEFHVIVDLSALRDTTLTILATQTSLSGIMSQAGKATIVKDTAAPTAPIFNTNNFINKANQSSYFLTGTAEANAQVNINVSNVNGKAIEINWRANANGEYRIPVDLSALNDGDVTFKIAQMDQAKNVSPFTTKTLLKDTIGPMNINIDLLPSIFSGNMNNYKISGTAEPHITLDILLTDGVTNMTKTVTTDFNGRFELPISVTPLNDGNITVSFIATDAAGNIGEPQPVTITKDTKAPAEAVATVEPFVNRLNMTDYSITGSSVEEGAQVKAVVSDGTTEITKTAMVINGSFEADLDLSSLKDGRLTFELTQTDKAGNTSIVQASTIEKDTVVENPIVSKNGFGFENQQSIYTIIGTSEPNATIGVSILNTNGDELLTKSSTADSKGFYSINIYLDEVDPTGEITASVTQTDLAGNISERTAISLYSHTVSTGETLYTIAKRYNTTVDALMALNHLTSQVIQPNQALRLPVTASEVINLGYMYFGNTKEYINMVNQTASSVNTVSPSYFDINSDGTLKLTYQVDPNFVETMHQRGVRVVPFLSNHWNREVGRAMLQNKELAVQQIADAIERYNLDGVNVDIENVTDADRDNYTEFVRLLRQKIPSTKEVSVAVAANPNGWKTGWHGSYDYTNLAKYADYLMIMSYDESYPGGKAGPVASYSWVEKSIQYALNQQVAADKIVVGVAHFGRYWIEGASYGGHGISNSKIEELIEKYNGTVVFDEISKTPKALITIKEGDPLTVVGGSSLRPGTYTIWYDNEESIRHKLSLVSQYNLRGVGNWSIGQENTDVWNSYSTSLPTTVPVTSPIYTDVTEPPVGQTYTTYTVVSGDNLWSIANRNNTTISKIKEINNLSTDTVYIGQTLKIPTTEDNETVPTPVKSTITYTVVSGDSLSVIAKRYNTTVIAIKEENRLTTENIYVGQTLNITTTNNQLKENVTTYTVVSGDSLSVIAKKYNTTVTSIKEANNLTSDAIYVGQTLNIPAS
ncbi:LysM peptidoglycan-binding domain-containing protein [Metabacillus herbersteinensis]|uniref:LysM peptidoglycan-binding domain-containing protein n=1 Tax=Metabacillus herbersteinensis TaxID=283816 RepID=A0ABV6GLM0_9BACI